MAELRLIPGHIHQPWGVSGSLVTVWLTPDPDRWHLSLASGSPRATEAAVYSDQVEALLEEVGFRAEKWVSWEGPLHERNPSGPDFKPVQV